MIGSLSARVGLLVSLLVGAALAPGSVRSESFLGLRDPGYGLEAGLAQASPVLPSVRQIAYPVLGMPALVRPGETFSVLLRVDCQPDLVSVEAQLELVRSPERQRTLSVLGLTPDSPSPGLMRLALRVPIDLAADSYHLRLEDGACLDDHQPSAVRIHRAEAEYRFAVLADEQLGDPTGHLAGGEANGTLHPGRGLVDLAERRRLQIREELEFLDPLFVLYPGDLCFGMDLPGEYADVARRLSASRLAVFVVPGNHDAYATHSVSMRDGWHRRVHRAAFCVGSLATTSPLDGLEALGGCVLDRMGDLVEYRLETDGLLGFQRTLGPDSYAFRVGPTRFVGLNTYGGSAARRMAVPFSFGRLKDWIELDLLSDAGLDPLLGAPLVDNFGGFLAPADLAWLDGQVLAAREAGESLVVFGHHDPGGRYMNESAVKPNEPFGNDPVGLGGFEVWNYDDGWDSDEQDGLGRETADAHGGRRLLDSLAGAEATFVCGHSHYDHQRDGGDEEVRVVQVTTAGAGLAHDEAHRGYRLVNVEDGVVGQADFAPDLGWGSVPSGNFWTRELPRADGPPDRELFTGLPVPIRGRLRFELPPSPTGHRFLLAVDDQPERPLGPVGFGHDEQGVVAYVSVELPPASVEGPVAQESGELVHARVRWEVATDNQPPRARILLAGRRTVPGKPLRGRSGRPVELSAAGSEDDQPLHVARWDVGGLQIEGFEPRPVLHRPGTYRVVLHVVDSHGAVGEANVELRIRRAFWPWRR